MHQCMCAEASMTDSFQQKLSEPELVSRVSAEYQSIVIPCSDMLIAF